LHELTRALGIHRGIARPTHVKADSTTEVVVSLVIGVIALDSFL